MHVCVHAFCVCVYVCVCVCECMCVQGVDREAVLDDK